MPIMPNLQRPDQTRNLSLGAKFHLEWFILLCLMTKNPPKYCNLTNFQTLGIQVHPPLTDGQCQIWHVTHDLCMCVKFHL